MQAEGKRPPGVMGVPEMAGEVRSSLAQLASRGERHRYARVATNDTLPVAICSEYGDITGAPLWCTSCFTSKTDS
jgi:hypothetical protein